MTQVKICGLCRPEDAAAAAAAGASYAGVVLAPGRLRTQTPSEAARILDAAGPLRRVGVFVDARPHEIERVATSLRLDTVQLHGAESVELVAALRAAGPWTVWKAVRVTDRAAAAEGVRRYGGVADGIVLDGGAGGAGVAFDWTAAAGLRAEMPPDCLLVVAGGLGPHNVGAAVDALSPAVVDVSSGVETSPGVKSYELMAAFVAAARRASPAGR